MDSMELYIHGLDELQSLIDASDPCIPVILVGDMKTSLPCGGTISKSWFQKRPFSKRSLMLYEFLLDNEFCVGNFIFRKLNIHSIRVIQNRI